MLYAKESMRFPKVTKIRQHFPVHHLANVESEVIEQLEMCKIKERIRTGKRIAIATGSRGISNIHSIVKTVVDQIKAWGGLPFVVPSMGSQGGGTPEGKIEVLQGLGITEDLIKAPIRSSMEVLHLGTIEDGCPVYFDRLAAEADGIIAINRIKPHTHAKGGPYESGVVKMLSIGLGNLEGCQSLHAYGFPRLSHRIGQAAELILQQMPILLGIGILEDAYDNTAVIEAIRPENILERERVLLQKSYSFMPSLPSDDLDVLVVKWVGKNISGPGMDPNITGRGEIRAMKDMFTKPVIRRVVALNLTDEAYGNAAGIGAADYITQKMLQRINLHDTNVNCVASSLPEGAQIPPALDDDREAIYAGLMTYGRPDPFGAKMIVIHSTLHLGSLLVSPSVLNEVVQKDYVEVISGEEELGFDSRGNLSNEWVSHHC